MNSETKKSRTRSIANQLNGHFKRRDFFKMLFLDILVVCAILITWGLTVESIHGGRIFNVTSRRVDGLKIPESYHISEWFTDVTYTFTVRRDKPEETAVESTVVEKAVDTGTSLLVEVPVPVDSSNGNQPSAETTARIDEAPPSDVPPAPEIDTGAVDDIAPSVYTRVEYPYYVTITRDADTIFTMLALGVICVVAVQLFFFIISCFTGKRTIKKYLRPIDEIALTAERISAESLMTSEREISSMRQENNAKMRNLEESINEIGTFDERIDTGDSELGGLEAAVNNMLKRLAESNRKQIRFVDDASHELRTPIAVIQGYVNMLDRWGKDDPKVMEESISAIKAESEHMKTLVDQLLFLARGDMDRLILSEEKVSLADLTGEIYEESVMIDKDHEYRQILPETDADISVDLAMFKQCVRILIDNAAKYTPVGGCITIKSYAKEGNAYIEVTDTGEGISKEDMPHIFDRFYRSASARGKQGSGLGLSIAKWIVEKHNGRIDAISREGTGTRMTVVIKTL